MVTPSCPHGISARAPGWLGRYCSQKQHARLCTYGRWVGIYLPSRHSLASSQRPRRNRKWTDSSNFVYAAHVAKLASSSSLVALRVLNRGSDRRTSTAQPLGNLNAAATCRLWAAHSRAPLRADTALLPAYYIVDTIFFHTGTISLALSTSAPPAVVYDCAAGRRYLRRVQKARAARSAPMRQGST